MGRWQRKKKSKKNRGIDSQHAWNDQELKGLHEFLRTYRDSAIRVYYNENEQEPIEEGLFETAARKVGNTELPILTQSALNQPYLSLPRTLRSKQRKAIHQACVELGLYHATVQIEETDGFDRHLVISVYADGFHKIHNQLRVHQVSFPFHKYRPWFYRKEREQQRANTNGSVAVDPDEASARTKIEALIDQPGDSIREYIDVLPILDTVGTLANIAPPGDKNWKLIDSAAAMQECLNELSANRPSVIAFDLEACNQSKFAQLTCLLQLAVGTTPDAPIHQHYVIDTLAPGVWDTVRGLADFFADPSIVKVGHSISGLDVQSLHRDFGIFLVNAFDTYEAAKVLHLRHHGLVDVCHHYGMTGYETYAALKQAYQTCDWTKRPLTKSMIQYGRYDINYLIPLREIMMRDLTREAWALPSSNNEMESQLVANALAETLRQFDAEENDGGDWNNTKDEGISDDSVDNWNVSVDEDGVSTEQEFSTEAGDGKLKTLESFGNDSAAFLNTQQSLQEEEEDDSFFDAVEASKSNMTDDTDDNSTRKERPTQLKAAELRMQPNLMRVVSISQERCLKLWKTREEPPMQNQHLVSLLRRSKRGEILWSKARTRLYNHLVQWRERVAQDLECLAPFVVPLDFLVHLALRRPVDEASMRQILHALPHILEENDHYRQQVFELIRVSFEEEPQESSSSKDKACLLYSSRSVKATSWLAEGFSSNREAPNFTGSASKSTRRWSFVAVAAVITVATVVVIATRRSKRR